MILQSNTTIKTMWKIVNIETGKKNCPKLDFTDTIGKSQQFDKASKTEIANQLNMQFISAAKQCAAPKPNIYMITLNLNQTYPSNDRSMRIGLFTAQEIYKIINCKVANKPTKDIYEISVELLRNVSGSIAEPLAMLFNCCIREGNYPKPLKEVRICPLYKGKGKKDDPNSYRPIAIIPAVAKIFENGLTTRISKFLAGTETLSDRQYAYREGRSTTMLAREVIRRVLKAREQKKEVAVLLCDLSKAFDVADHDALALKLEHYGITGPALRLVVSFMRERRQYVCGDQGKVKSVGLSSTVGVPQGSSLSNLAFSLLLNDLPGVISEGEVFMYADDVAAVVSASDLDELEQRLNAAATELLAWFSNNGLKLNLTKTQYIVLNLSGRTRRQLVVNIEGASVEQVQCAPFLGFRVDSTLTWESHIDHLCGKLGSACFALSRVASTLPRREVIACYFASVQSLLQYGVELWGRAADWQRVFRMQKRAVRVIARIEPTDSARPHFSELGILTLPCLLILQVAMYTRENLELYKRRGDKGHMRTRYAHKLSTVSRKLAKTANTIHVMGPDVYNRLPDDVTNAPNVNSFKNKTKKWLLARSFYSYKEFLDYKQQ